MPGQPGSAGAITITSGFDKQGKLVDEIRMSVTD